MVKNKTENEITNTLLALEVAALERWGKGDPYGFLEISDKDVVYFDPFIESRIDGLENLTAHYEKLKGHIIIDHFDILNPCFQGINNIYVLTYNFISFTNGKESKWNCTEVYENKEGEWKIIQTHWSFTMVNEG